MRKPPHIAASVPYRIFTKEFDVVTDADSLDEVIGRLSPSGEAALEDAWDAFQNGLQGWRTQLHVIALESSARIARTIPEAERTDILVAVLVDQSGSMRGQSMLLAAAAADVAQNFLSQLGCSVEILGFTTSTWHGGKSRKRWRRTWRPAHPGRLCDLLHIIYRSAEDERTSTGGFKLKPMLRGDLPKENVDGEALEWAAGRLRARPEKHKILLTVSDGAPVDDSTLMANDVVYLERHLLSVISNLEHSNDIQLAAIGIGHNVGRYYSTSTVVKNAHDLGEAMLQLLEKMLVAPSSAPHP